MNTLLTSTPDPTTTQSTPPSANSPPHCPTILIELGWPSAVLIESGKYRTAIEDYVNGDTSVGEGLLCTAMAEGTVWDEYGFGE